MWLLPGGQRINKLARRCGRILCGSVVRIRVFPHTPPTTGMTDGFSFADRKIQTKLAVRVFGFLFLLKNITDSLILQYSYPFRMMIGNGVADDIGGTRTGSARDARRAGVAPAVGGRAAQPD